MIKLLIPHEGFNFEVFGKCPQPRGIQTFVKHDQGLEAGLIYNPITASCSLV